MAPGTSFALDHVRRRRPTNRPEQTLQLDLVRILKLALTPATAFLHVPNGGKRGPVEAAIFVGMGVMRGFPDLLFIHEGRAFGLELKAAGGSLDVHQHAAHARLRDAGMRVEVARSLDEAFEHLRDMGIPLRLKDGGFSRAAVKSVFRDDARRRAA